MKRYSRSGEAGTVLKIHVVHAGGHGYYLEGRGSASDLELPGTWTGPAAPSLGLAGVVEPGGFDRLMGGYDPRSGRALRLGRGAAGVSGFDLTFCAPKSVSLLHALAPPEIAAEAEEGHRVAVADAGGYLSRHAVGVRRGGPTTLRLLPSTGMVAGEFRHRVSRALDPHLHTHLVTANLAQGTDGVWSAVDGRRLFGHLRAAGRLYHSRLRLELSDRLGAAWEVRSSGLGDVVGVDPALRRLFSQRAAAIDEFVRTRHGDHPGRRSGAFYATRPEKDRSPSLDALSASWRQRAADFGFDLGELSGVVGRGRAGRLDRVGRGVDPDRLAEALDAAARPGRTVARRDLVAVVAAAAVRGATFREVDGVVERIAASVPPDDTLRRAREPRWPADDVARLARRRGSRLVAAAVPGRDDDMAVGGSRTVDRSPWRDRDRHRGPGLGR
ncbi:MAG: MobF family relaxase [Acidimicrobiales bacterium]